MDSTQVTLIGRELIITAILLCMPAVVVSLIVGLIISIFQTITSIQEQTLSFAPRIFAVGVVLIIAMPWSLQIVNSFALRMFWRMTEAVH